jgi:hypothetical protein
MGAAVGNGVVALESVVDATCRDAANGLVLWDLSEKIGQHRCFSDVAPGDLDGSNFQRFLVDPEVDLAPDPPFWATMLAGAPLAFALDLDPSAVDQQVRRSLRPMVGDVDGKGFLTAGQRAEVVYRPVETNQPQQARGKPDRLPERHAEQHLHRKARMNGGVAESPMSTALACRPGLSAHLGVEPDSQRAPALERVIVGWPVPSLVTQGYVSAHATQLTCWIHEMNPLQDL